MSANLDQLDAAEATLSADDCRRLEAFLLGWLASATPQAMWNAGIEAWLDSEQRRMPAV